MRRSSFLILAVLLAAAGCAGERHRHVGERWLAPTKVGLTGRDTPYGCALENLGVATYVPAAIYVATRKGEPDHGIDPWGPLFFVYGPPLAALELPFSLIADTTHVVREALPEVP